MIGPLPGDIRHEEAMIAGSAMLRQAIEAHRQGRPFKTSSKLVWWHQMQGPEQDLCSRNSIVARRVAARLEEKAEMAERNRKHRDPCYFCGVKADVGCKHHPERCLPERARV